jgi:hypothetical protein
MFYCCPSVICQIRCLTAITPTLMFTLVACELISTKLTPKLLKINLDTVI